MRSASFSQYLNALDIAWYRWTEIPCPNEAFHMLRILYELDRPVPLEKGLSNLDLEAIGLEELKDLGL